MDHLPCPGSAKGSGEILVPYVCEGKYDGGPFMTYPRRTGSYPDFYTVGLFPGQLLYSHQMQLAQLPKRELESFYQTWLFFGLIHEILGDRICVPEDLIYACEDRGGYTRAISTSKLIPALEEWVDCVQTGTTDPSLTPAHVARCLCLTHAALCASVVRSNFDPDIKFCIASLGQTITYAATKAFNRTEPVLDHKYPSTWRSLIDVDYEKGRLLKHGWCVSEVKFIMDTAISLQTLHFLARIDKKDKKLSHHGCDPQQCMIYQIDLKNYQTRHVSKGCDCEDLSIDPEDLHNVLNTNALPLIRVRPSQTLAELSVEVIASRPTSRYVALSHVWADGLGNPTANALPRCQLLDLGRLVHELDLAARSQNSRDDVIREEGVEEEEEEELLLWCDTLCCPVRPKEAKHLALGFMDRTYRKATHVLVLDASLRRYNIERLDMDEVSMRIATSPWMRRLWTLQEGALPAVTNRLWFQLAHKVVNVRELRTNACDKFFSSIRRRGLAGDMLRRLGSFAEIFLKDNSIRPRADLGRVMEALHHRSVSIVSDEPLLIGNLLGLDAGKILDGSDGAVAPCMNRLWRLMPSAVHGIPSNLLFRVGPRLAEPGLRWAPATLLVDNDVNVAIQSSEKEDEQAILTPSDGLLVRLHGLRLSLASRAKGLPSPHRSIAQLDSPNCLWVQDDSGSWYLIRRRLPVEQDNFLTDETLADVILKCENTWVIYPDSNFPRQSNGQAQATVGLLVEVKSEEKTDKEETAVKKAQAKLHIEIAPTSASISAWYAVASHLSSTIVSDSPTLRKLAAMEYGLDEQSSTSPSLEQTALEELASEIREIAKDKGAEKAIAAAGNTFNSLHLEEAITMVLWGRYVRMGEMVPKCQQWCVD